MNYTQNPFFQKFGPGGYYEMAASMLADKPPVSGVRLDRMSLTYRTLNDAGFFSAPGAQAWADSFERPTAHAMPAAPVTVHGIRDPFAAARPAARAAEPPSVLFRSGLSNLLAGAFRAYTAQGTSYERPPAHAMPAASVTVLGIRDSFAAARPAAGAAEPPTVLFCSGLSNVLAGAFRAYTTQGTSYERARRPRRTNTPIRPGRTPPPTRPAGFRPYLAASHGRVTLMHLRFAG
jgi:hypothetical protein